MSRSHPLVKRSETLVFFFDQGRLHCRNYLTGAEVTANPALVEVLAQMSQGVSPRQLERRLPHYTPASVRSSLRELRAATLVRFERSRQAQREKALAAWKPWGVEAAFFHFGTKRAHRTPFLLDEAAFNRALLKSAPQPAPIKRYPRAQRHPLPDFRAGLPGEFPRVLLARRTHRDFAPTQLSLAHLSTLLGLTWSITGTRPWPGLAPRPLKTSPSGGARHSLEVYVWALNVAGLPRGVYHYRPDRHFLERVRRGASAERVARQCGHQEWIGQCAALFVMTSVVPRVMWRYRFARAYRVVLLEAGHFGQTFCLAATWLGLAPFTTAALDDESIEAELGLDGARESVIYAAGVGSLPEGPRKPAARAEPAPRGRARRN